MGGGRSCSDTDPHCFAVAKRELSIQVKLSIHTCSDELWERPKQCFLRRGAGLSLSGSVRNVVIWEGLRAELLLPHMKTSQVRWFRHLDEDVSWAPSCWGIPGMSQREEEALGQSQDTLERFYTCCPGNKAREEGRDFTAPTTRPWINRGGGVDPGVLICMHWLCYCCLSPLAPTEPPFTGFLVCFSVWEKLQRFSLHINAQHFIRYCK